jgi:hypothetical protein
MADRQTSAKVWPPNIQYIYSISIGISKSKGIDGISTVSVKES